MIGQTIGSYVLESKLGEGGMGEVYLGRHQSLDTLAAVKVMAPAFSHDPRLHERFSREAKTQAQLRHPNIAQVLDHVEHDGRWFLVVEYMPNGTLEDALAQRHEPLETADALAWGRQALLGLDHAHERGIVHRDIKPANLLINERGEAAVTDFGIALEAGARRLTQTGVSIGTPEYMSPEQIRGAADLDRRTDIYSMGVVLYELLANRVPFHADSIFEVQRAQVSDPPPPLRTAAPQVPEALEAIVMRALAKDPDERYATCGEFAESIESFERGEDPVVPLAPAPIHRRTVLEGAVGAPPVPTPSPLPSPRRSAASSPEAPSSALPPTTLPHSRSATMALSPPSAGPSPAGGTALPPPGPKKKSWTGWVAA
ncbi:MAG: protein kinase, partial [Holophagales bacterium]|nr:protein kinase [Holophagales bacterium]